jgi:hypothetical protein
VRCTAQIAEEHPTVTIWRPILGADGQPRVFDSQGDAMQAVRESPQRREVSRHQRSDDLPGYLYPQYRLLPAERTER